MLDHSEAILEIKVKLPKIMALFNNGFTRGKAYRTLKEQGEIKCCRASFFINIKKFVDFTEIKNPSTKLKPEIKTEEVRINSHSDASTKDLTSSKFANRTKNNPVKTFDYNPDRVLTPDSDLSDW